MRTLLSPFEVIKYSAAGSSYPLDNIRILIPIYELEFMLSCLGEDFYNAMLKDKNSFEVAKQWVKGTTYNSGDLVIYNGSILECCNSLNSTEPSITNDKWREPDKFKKKSFNALWEYYLRSILAFKVYKEAIPQDTIKSSAKGLVVTAQDQSGAMTAQNKDIEYVLRHIQNQIDIQVNGMKNFITSKHKEFTKDSTKGYDFSTVNFIKEECDNCVESGKVNRRVGFMY